MEILSLAELEQFDSKNTSHGRQRRFLCPVCGEDKPKDAAHRSLAVNTESGLYLCHRCQTKGCLREFHQTRPIMHKKNQTRLKLTSHFSFETSKPTKSTSERSEDLSEKMARYRADFVHSPAEMYLLERGISTEIAVQGGCGYAEKWEHWEKREERWLLQGTDRRVVFPIYDSQGGLVAIHGRAIDARHHGSAKITKGDKSAGLFLSDAPVIQKKIVAVCEGAIDALALAMCGIPAVAMTGTTPPAWFYRKMAFKRVLVATDADEAGDKAAYGLKNELVLRGTKTFRLRPRHGKDWGEVLEKDAAGDVTALLAGFREQMSDVERLSALTALLNIGRSEAAEFAAGLINDAVLRENILYRLRTERYEAA